MGCRELELWHFVSLPLKFTNVSSNSILDIWAIFSALKKAHTTGGECTRVSADTLVKMADNYFVASASYRQIYRHCAFRGDPSFLRLLSLAWDTLGRKFQVVVGCHSGVIAAWKVAWWRRWCIFLFSQCRGWLFAMSRVTPWWTRVTHD